MLCISDAQVDAIVPANQVPDTYGVVRRETGFIAPGLVDLQVNGGGGCLFNADPSVAGIRTICQTHAQFGVTALLPTLITDEAEKTGAAIEAGIVAARENVPGFAGLHLEGPHISQAKKGAHPQRYIRSMTDADLEQLLKARRKLPALLVTVAPENATLDQVKALAAGGIRVSLGHTAGTYAVAQEYVAAGATMITHLFNAMSQMTARDPGVAGAALSDGRLSAGLIADGHHVTPEMIGTALRAKKLPGRIFLVSDAMPTVGSGETAFSISGREVRLQHGRLAYDDGTLAGAHLNLRQAVGFMAGSAGIDLAEVLRMAGLYPAEAMGWTDRGHLRPGARAEFCCFAEDLT